MKYIGCKQGVTEYVVPIIQKYVGDTNAIIHTKSFIGGVNLTKINFYTSNCGSLNFQKYPKLIYFEHPHKLDYSNNKVGYDNFWAWVKEQSKNSIVLISAYNAPNDFECLCEMQAKPNLDNISKTEKLFIYKGEQK